MVAAERSRRIACQSQLTIALGKTFLGVSMGKWESVEKDLSAWIDKKDNTTGHRVVKKLGYYTYLIGEIPNKPAMNFLKSRGHNFNNNGEILMTEEESEEYQMVLSQIEHTTGGSND